MADRVFRVVDNQVRVSVAGGPLIAALAGAAAAAEVLPLTERAEAAEQSIADIMASAGEVQGGGSVTFQAAGSGSAVRSVQAKLRETVSVFDKGAVGDGVTDDTAAFQAAMADLRPGGTLHLGDGYSFLLSESLIFEKPTNIRGGSMEQTKLIFDADGIYQDVGDGTRGAMIITHSQTVLTGFSGDARRSVWSGFTAELQDGGPANTRGIIACAPAYLYEVWVRKFTLGGFNVMAGDGSPIDGIANGTTFTNCIAHLNHTGFYFVGNDANACKLTRCHAADNAEWGFYDDSLLGNTYDACEADGNGLGGYFSTDAKPNRSTYIGCYSETVGHFDIGTRSININPQGAFKPSAASGGVCLAGLPIGVAYLTQDLHIADTDDIANSRGDSPNAGRFIGWGPGGIDFKGDPAGLHFRLTGLNSANYTDMMNGSNYMLRMAKAAIAGNLNASTPWMPGGFVLGGNVRSGIVGAGAAAPTTGSYDIGAIWLNESPVAAGKVGWVCVSPGSPGTWKAFGSIDA